MAGLVAGAFFMEYLDATVITTALPEMAQSFRVRAVDLSAGLSAYMLALAVFIPISGWAVDRFGARRVFGAAIAIFTLASAWCGLSCNLEQFVAGRALQGMGGAMMVPVGRVVVLRSTAKRELTRAIATITWPGLVAPVIGPPLGGFITSTWNWRWIFFLNIPLGLAALALAVLLIRPAPRERLAFDRLGFLLSAIGLSASMYGLDLVGRASAGRVTAALAVGGAAIYCAIVHFSRVPRPLLNIFAIAARSSAVALRGGSLFRVVIGSAPFLLPLLFQVGLGMSAVASGTLLLFLFAGNILMIAATPRVLRRFGFRNVLIVNGILNAAAFVAFAFFGPRSPLPAVALVLFASGLFRSLQFTTLSTLAFTDVAPAQMSSASTIFSVFGQISAGIGIVFGAIALRTAQWVRGVLSDHLAISDFRVAFLLGALLALLATLDFLTLPRNAGAEVSGHRRV